MPMRLLIGPGGAEIGARPESVYGETNPSRRGSLRARGTASLVYSTRPIDRLAPASVWLAHFSRGPSEGGRHGIQAQRSESHEAPARREGHPDEVVQHPGRPQDPRAAGAPPRHEEPDRATGSG